MNPIHYIAEITFCLVVFYGTYALLLSKETFFSVNRLYLLGTLLLSLLLPYLIHQIDFTAYEATVNLPSIAVGSFETNFPNRSLSNSSILMGIYMIGALGFTIRLLIGLFQIRQLIRQGQVEQKSAYTLVVHQKIDTPFSFLNYLFVNEAALQNQQIIAHEAAHIQQKHSYDILLLECLTIVFWFHPLVHLYRNALQTVHEYLADASVIQHNSKRQYGLLLVNQTTKGFNPTLTNNFNSQLKKRIVMMTKNPSTKKAYWKYALVLPLLTGLFLMFSFNELQAQKTEVKTVEYEDLDVKPIFGDCNTAESVADCSIQNLMMHVYTNIKYPKEAHQNGTDGTAVISFVVDKEGKVTKAAILKDLKDGCGAEALRVVKEMPNWVPGKKDGKAVAVKMVLPVKYKMEDDTKEEKKEDKQ